VSADDGETRYEYNCSVVVNPEEERIEIYEEKTYDVYRPFTIALREMTD